MKSHHGNHKPYIKLRKPVGSAWAIYKRLFGYSKRYWPYFVIAIIANMCYSGIDASFTYLLKPLLDKGFIERDSSFLRWVPFIIPILFLARTAFNFAGNYFMAWVGRSVVMQFRQDIFKHYMSLPAKFYDHHSSGQLLSLITYNTAQVSNACTEAISHSVQSAFLVLGLMIVMLKISWQLTLIFFVTIPLSAITVKLLSRRMRRINLKIQETMGHVTHVAEEVIESFKVVRLFGGQNYESEKFNHVTSETARQEMKAVVTKSINVSTVQFLGVLALSGMIVIGTSASGVQQLSAGSFAAMIAAMLALLKPLKELTTVSSIIQRGLAGVESIFGLLDEPVEKDTGTLSLQRANGAISFQQVNFSYERNDPVAIDVPPVLSNINIDIRPGTTVALVGRSGSGKTTLVNLLPRFYECASGQILLDGVPVQNYKLEDLRNQFALVSQNITLFNDTVAHNIAYGRLAQEVTEAEIVAAAKAAYAMEFIESLPNGIHSVIGENGVLLSGGQRQRLAIARAILKNAPILILDEATSALDTESERMIQAALDKLIKNRTTIIVAHRLSTIEKADQIIVLDNGEIKEKGTHQQLFQLDGYYAKFHKLQFNFNQDESAFCEQIMQ